MPRMWAETAKVWASDAVANDYFGNAVSHSSGRILVGASRDEKGSVLDSGSAYVFRRINGYWIQEVKLEAPDAENGDQFGY